MSDKEKEKEDKDKENFKELVAGRFKVDKKIGAGSFGELRLGEITDTKEGVAIKLEPRKVKGPTLPQEHKFYQKVGEAEGIPKIHFFGQYGKFNAMVMELLWKSLQDCFEWNGKKFTVKTTIQVAVQMITRIETVHSKGIVYRDIKPENFLFGKQPKHHLLYLIDFGLAKEYLDKDGKHIKYREGKSLTGTARYMSINTHLGKEQSRRDDLEAIAHTLIYFLRGNLPWMKLKCNDKKNKYKLIGETKQEISIETLCAGLPDEFGLFLKYARGLDFYDSPDYNYCRKLFQDLFTKSNFATDDVYDWDNLSEKPKAKKESAKKKESDTAMQPLSDNPTKD